MRKVLRVAAVPTHHATKMWSSRHLHNNIYTGGEGGFYSGGMPTSSNQFATGSSQNVSAIFTLFRCITNCSSTWKYATRRQLRLLQQRDGSTARTDLCIKQREKFWCVRAVEGNRGVFENRSETSSRIGARRASRSRLGVTRASSLDEWSSCYSSMILLVSRTVSLRAAVVTKELICIVGKGSWYTSAAFGLCNGRVCLQAGFLSGRRCNR